MSILVVHERCVRQKSVASGCKLCINSCDYDALELDGAFVRLISANCTECAACLFVCPTGAMDSDGGSVIGVEGVFAAAASEDSDYILEVTENTAFDWSVVADEANALLDSAKLSQKVVVNFLDSTMEKSNLDGSKRALFRMFSKDGVKEASKKLKNTEELTGELDFSALKTRFLPKRRFDFLSLVSEKQFFGDLDTCMPLSFATDKHIDESCDNCSLCYNLCPSGALETTAMKNAVLFSPYLCLKCKLCEDVCEKKAISSLPAFGLAYFANKQKKVLIRFKSKICPSCGIVFTGDGNECARCAKESEDAMELLGL